MYTESGDTPLGEILDKVYAHFEGKPVDVKALDSAALHTTFGEIVEDYDRDRVRDNDIKKLFKWYNLLTASGMTHFAEEPEAEETDKQG